MLKKKPGEKKKTTSATGSPRPSSISSEPTRLEKSKTPSIALFRDILKNVAYNFSLRSSENEIFNYLWKTYKKQQHLKKEVEEEMALEVLGAFNHLRSIADGRFVNVFGHRLVKRVSSEGKYVIFSDHHMAYDGHRQNFFVQSGNRDLYCEILEQYFAAGYTLIENGDVEELVIFEPTLSEVKFRSELSWAELMQHRLETRPEQLSLIIQDNETLYDQIAATFHQEGRYIRIAGNHDQDLPRPELFPILEEKYPNLISVYDYVVIEPLKSSSEPSPLFIIGHGHQFDKSTNPRFSPRIGEVVSESLAWAFQGPDRIWKWIDDVQAWATGRPFPNTLVSDEHDPNFNVEDIIAFVAGALLPDPGVFTLSELFGRFPHLLNSEFWECLFEHKIAWEYFESRLPRDAVVDEVLTGNEFFKFRHLNELLIATRLPEVFSGASRIPCLVLGHTHEPRFQAVDPERKVPFPSYINSGAAGRFENLIWCVEIVDAEPRVVAWHRPQVRNGAPRRHIYTSRIVNGAGQLVPSERPMPLQSFSARPA